MSTQVTMAQAINWALHDAMTEDGTVLVLGEDVGDKESGGVIGITKGLSTAFGTARVKSTPISEQAIMGAAIGAAMIGFKPVAEIMLMNFLTVASDMLVNHAAKLRFMSGGQTNVPITVRTMTGAGMGNGGQHSDYWEAWFAHIPGLKIVQPSNPADAYGLLRSCIEDPDPCIFVETLPILYAQGEPPTRGSRVPIGKAKTLREGKHVSIIAYGRIVNMMLPLIDKLAAENISVELIDLRSVSPYDADAVLASVQKTGAAIIVHEAVKKFGVGAEIAATLHEKLHARLRAPVIRIGAKFAPVPFCQTLESASLPSLAEIESAIRRLAAVN